MANQRIRLASVTGLHIDIIHYIHNAITSVRTRSVDTTTADITAKSVTGQFTAADKGYDGNTAATVTGRLLTGVEPGDTVSLTGGTATFDSADVGTDKTVTLTA